MEEQVTGIILAGGQSRRMGQDKALVKLQQKTLLEMTAETISAVFRHKALVTGEKAKYQKLGWNIILDQYPGCGPLSGIQAALSQVKTPYIFVAACDMPYIKTVQIQRLLNLIDDWDVILPYRNGHWEPLCGLYHQNCLKPIEAVLQQKKYRVESFFPQVRVKQVLWEEQDLSLSNINTPQELAQMQQKFK
ncbi:MAG: molybdenum cofactor guanylyltransferase [Clostridia bacterium]|nr:molybdenum cofactor guanylyltransferase [Clostridia bacterium]